MKAILPTIIAVAAVLSACSTTTTNPIPAARSAARFDVEGNKRLVMDFYELAINGHQPAAAAEKYIGARYIQHNPAAPDGPQMFVKFFEDFLQNYPNAHAQIKRVVADGDLVAVHAHWKRDENDRGTAVVDIFRVEGGKIVEHWDVVQPVPEQSLNSNTMF
jgi:predicted SnoaL-like aldol condensation-catalyzing enzyme